MIAFSVATEVNDFVEDTGRASFVQMLYKGLESLPLLSSGKLFIALIRTVYETKIGSGLLRLSARLGQTDERELYIVEIIWVCSLFALLKHPTYSFKFEV